MACATRAERIAAREAPALAVFLVIVPLSSIAAMGVWAFEGDRDRRFGLLMLCVGVAVLGLAVLTGYRLLRGVWRPAGVLESVLTGSSQPSEPSGTSEPSGSSGDAPPPPLPRRVPREAGWRLLAGIHCTGLAGWLVSFWFVGVGNPEEQGRLHSDGELWLWGAALAVIVLLCTLNAEGTVHPVLPGRARALRVTLRNGRLVAHDGLQIDLRVPRVEPEHMSAALNGRNLWLCWDPLRTKRDFTLDGPPRGDCAAVLVLDGGRAVRARALFPPDRSPGAEGDPVGGPRVPVDPARRVGSWTSYMAWPLLLPWQGIGCYALVLLLSGGLCTEGAPRGLLAVPGAVALVAAFSYHPFLFLDRALAPAWYRTRDPERADRLSRAVLRASALTRLAMVVPVTAVAALLIWLAGPGPGRRVALTAGCPALAGLVLLVLLVHRVATGPIRPYELERSAPRAAPGPGRARSVVGVVGLVGWGAGMVLFLPLSDVTIDPQLERLRAAGAVVAEVPIETTRLVKRHYTVSKGAETSHQFAATQLLGVRLRGDDGHSDTATVRTMSDGDGRTSGERITVVHAPGDTGPGAYTGRDSRESLRARPSQWEHYQDDLPRLLAGRPLSGRQLAVLGGAWLLVVGFCAVRTYRDPARNRRPFWPLTSAYLSFSGYAAALAISAVLLTDHWATGFSRLGGGLLGAFALFVGYALREPFRHGSGAGARRERG